MDKAGLILLKAELTNDPLARGYSTMSDLEAANDLNTLYRTGNKEILTGQEMFYNTDTAEYGALTDSKKNEWLGFCGIGEVDPFNPVVVNFVQYIFGVGSDTIVALAAARVESISRAQEGGIPLVYEEDVDKARTNDDI